MEKTPLQPQSTNIKLNLAQRTLLGKNLGNSFPSALNAGPQGRTKLRSASCAREVPRIATKIPIAKAKGIFNFLIGIIFF